DWQRPSADEIVERSIAEATDPNPDVRGQIILLRDSGGDRSNTVDALPKLIDALRARGFEFVPVSELAGMTRDQAMPPAPEQSLARIVGLPVFMTLSWVGKALTTVFFAALCLGVLRLLFLCVVALCNRRKETKRTPPALPRDPPLRTGLIAAHSAGTAILPTLRS